MLSWKLTYLQRNAILEAEGINPLNEVAADDLPVLIPIPPVQP